MKTVLITGGSRGLGKSMALFLAQKGFDVIITYQTSEHEALKVVEEIKHYGRQSAALPLDVSKSDTFSTFSKELALLLDAIWHKNQLDILINNAGIGINQSFEQTSTEAFDTLMNIHLKGPFFLTQTLLPLIADGGKILNVSTGLTRFSIPGYAAYAMMKGGIEVLTHYLALELGKRRISVNVVAPGAIETDFAGGVNRDNPKINAYIASQIALGRVGLPEDIGAAVSLLVSDDASWINGQRIEVSGGMRL